MCNYLDRSKLFTFFITFIDLNRSIFHRIGECFYHSPFSDREIVVV